MDVPTAQEAQAWASYVPADRGTSPGAATTRLRKRSSLPAPIKSPKRPPSTYARTQAASPEVISSLIDQLSAIALPAHNHFENLAVGYGNSTSVSLPASPGLHTFSRFPSHPGHHGPAPDHTALYDALREQNQRYPDDGDDDDDDACEPPVVRTSKPPSGRSALTAPRKTERPHSLTSYIKRSASSSASIHSAHSNRSACSIGNVSVEAGIQRQPSAGSNRSSAESKRSLKGRSLMYMSSREQLKQKETDRKRASAHPPDDLASPTSPRKTAHLFPYEDTIKEEPHAKEDPLPPLAEPSRLAQWYPSRGDSPRRIRINLVDGPGGESPAEKGLIPARRSSLHHSGSPTKKGKKSQASKRSERERERHNTATAPPRPPLRQESDTMDSESVMKEKILEELEQEESDVAKRIRQLRQQKLLRDKLAGKLPEDSNAEASSYVTHVPASSSPDCSPTSTNSSASEPRVQSSTKAHKILGINTGRAMTDSPPDRKGTRSVEPQALDQKSSWRHARHRSLTVNDGDDFNSLPINYTLALQSLAGSAPSSPVVESYRAESYRAESHRAESLRPISPAPPSISMGSTRNTISSRGTMQRSNSFVAVGGRSAVGRKVNIATSIGAPTRHRHSSSITSDTASERLPSLRSTSEDISSRPQTLNASLSASNVVQLQQRRGLKKQRWSHPDLPAKVEKEHNGRIDAQEAVAPVQKPSRPAPQERPDSIDSVDIDVNKFLNAPRLSQKIRHPQTGRIISFSEVGDPEGFAIFVCVGMGLTRFVMAFYDQLAFTLKLRLITPERPGIGGSQADPNGTPLSWPDDVLVICQALKITKFSLLAHSAGAVYALATSLRMPQHIRGRVHLLAPWIPPSQMAPIGMSQDSPPTQQLPRSQRFLRTLPPSLLKIANSTFLSSTSASLQRTGPKNSSKIKRRPIGPQAVPAQAPPQRPSLKDTQRNSMLLMDQVLPNATSLSLAAASPTCATFDEAREALSLAEQDRQRAFDERLTFAIWDRATANANPATDLIVCLETKQPIGFRYEDINRPVVIHHGSKDSRVPADNVRWLGKLMRKCEVRILEGEQHGLMASANVMGNVLTEMASDWEDWTAITGQKSSGDLRTVAKRRTMERLRNAGA
ncbi:alpha/beta-hydrolase [Dothidotthia symphoricarpi CBS 119687]|uniref:Alpha/beta-hydrolase n=1 Tax=Dothidotthia symphoricarpi CBS 119687 TaxID=1392245 RepID=A0A6A6ACB3_9PLEO|nr:alpha/beta-hydrolase [Dothidotthia symphoricarpi CBS 119687]KAF2129542.1 alpha/beta-hydrolase [Dothidotthia symphoricarpi CBS 119687]